MECRNAKLSLHKNDICSTFFGMILFVLCERQTNELQLIFMYTVPENIQHKVYYYNFCFNVTFSGRCDAVKSKHQPSLSTTDCVSMSILHRCLDANSPSSTTLSLFCIRIICKIFACFMYYTNKMFSFLFFFFLAYKQKPRAKHLEAMVENLTRINIIMHS